MSESSSWSPASYSADLDGDIGGGADNRPSWMQQHEADYVSLPYSEQRTRDALIFLVDVSQAMRIDTEENGHSVESSTSSSSSISSLSHSHSKSKKSSSSSHSSDDENVTTKQRKKQPDDVFTVLGMIENAIRAKIITSPDDLVSVVLFGAREKNDADDGNNFDYIHVLYPLDQPEATLVKRLRDLSTNPALFDKQIGSAATRNAQLDRALWTCSTLFTKAANLTKRSTKRILIITGNDIPIDTSDKNARPRAIQKARDLKDSGVMIDLIRVDRVGKKFNSQLFFKHIISAGEEGEGTEGTMNDHLSDFQEEFMRKSHKKRALGSIEWNIADNVTIATKVYALYHEAKKDSPIFLEKATNQPLKAETKYVDVSTGEYATSFEIKKYFPYADENVFFTDDEIRTIKSTAGAGGDPGLVLMGFKPIDRVKPHYNIRSPYFLYPNEAVINGSTVLFTALLESMAQLNKVAICRFTYRKGSIPRFVALIPQLEELDPETGGQETPPGMHIVFLPYADDIRSLKFNKQARADNDQVVAAKNAVKRITSAQPFGGLVPRPYNPALQLHYAVIQSLALDEEAPAELPDETLPVMEVFSENSDVIDEYKHSVYGEDGTATMVKVKAKREPKAKASPAKKKAATKRKKKSEELEDDSDADQGTHRRVKREHVKQEEESMDEDDEYNTINWQAERDNGKLSKHTVAELKIYLKHHKLPMSGKKDDLIERIENHMDLSS